MTQDNSPNAAAPRSAQEFFRKYFLDGQCLAEECADLKEDPSYWDELNRRYRKYIAVAIPFCVIQTIWWIVAIRYDLFPLFATRWQMPLTMILGATVAGMTAEGGGAVAFPVMTLALHIDATTARDFSLMIQSFGMTAALFVVSYMGVVIEKRALFFGTVGCIPGFVVGINFFDPLLSGPTKKCLFVSIWASFAWALFLLNSEKKRVTFPVIPAFCAWKAIVLIATGFVGGVCTAFAGSGVDICTFSVITLLFRVTEKTATPTTITLMGVNTVIGFFYRGVIDGDISRLTWEYVAVCIPVVVTFSPLGSFFGSHFHRMVLACFVYILESIALVGFLLTGPPWFLVAIGIIVIAAGFLFFLMLSKCGRALLEDVQRKKSTQKS